MMRKSITCLLLLFLVAGLKAEIRQSGIIYGESHTNSFDVRDVTKYKDDIARYESRAAETSLKAPGSLSSKWIDRIYNMPQVLRDFYAVYGEKVHEVLNGGENWLSDPELGICVNDKYNAEIATYEEEGIEFTFPLDATPEEIGQAASAAVRSICMAQWEEVDNFMSFLCVSVSYDFPEGFWLNSSYSWSDRWSYGYSYYPTEGKGTVRYTHHIYFVLKDDDFDHRRNEFQKDGEVAAAVNEFNSKVGQIVSSCPNDSRYSQIVYFNNWLTTHNSYNSAFGHTLDVPTIAWSALSALRESTGETGPVCEGYARAFKVLCDQKNIPCMLVVGNAKNSSSDKGESHMWNEVQMKNGEWYAVDVTWNDPIDSQNRKVSGFEIEFWLLLGKKDLVSPGFTFEESHPNELTWGSEGEALWDYSTESLIADYKYEVQSEEGEEEEEIEDISEKVTIGNALVAGFSSNKPLDFTSLQDQGVSAWIATGFRNGNVLLSRVYAIPAGEGVYVKANNAGTYEIPTTTEETYYMNMFVGVPDGATVDQFEYVDGEKFLTLSFALSQTTGNPSFFPNTKPKTYGKNKMYLHMPARLLPEYATTRLNEFSLGVEFEDDETTGISEAKPLNNKEQIINGSTGSAQDKRAGVYDLQGRRMKTSKLKKGLYIVNGRKTVIP